MASMSGKNTSPRCSPRRPMHRPTQPSRESGPSRRNAIWSWRTCHGASCTSSRTTATQGCGSCSSRVGVGGSRCSAREDARASTAGSDCDATRRAPSSSAAFSSRWKISGLHRMLFGRPCGAVWLSAVAASTCSPRSSPSWTGTTARARPVRLSATKSIPSNTTSAMDASGNRMRPTTIAVEVAPPAGLEPATVGLEGRCSIQLSYESVPTR